MDDFAGYANMDSFLFDVAWANSQAIYEAFKSHARSMRYQMMTDQTLGLNMKNAVSAMLSDGGWGWFSCPDELVSVRSEAIRLFADIDIRKVNEEEFGAAIRAALEGDE